MAETQDETFNNRHWKTYVGRVLKRRCPRCGEGLLFQTRAKLNKQCEKCSLIYRREQGAMTGQLYLAAVITQIFAALVVGAIFIFTDWPVTFSIPFGLVLLAVFGYWIFPKTTALWVAIEFMTDVGNREKWIFETPSESDGDAGR